MNQSPLTKTPVFHEWTLCFCCFKEDCECTRWQALKYNTKLNLHFTREWLVNDVPEAWAHIRTAWRILRRSEIVENVSQD